MREPDANLEPPGHNRRWSLEPALVAVLALHVGLTLQLMGTTHQLRRLLSDEPVTSGRHPLHLQQSLASICGEPVVAASGSFDASCYAGYPRTSIFDAEARPVALVQWFAGRRAGAAAYKLGLIGFVALLPVGAWAAARLLNCGRGSGLVAAALGITITWVRPVEGLIEHGDLSVLAMAALSGLAIAGLARWGRSPNFFIWAGLAGVEVLGWNVHPGYWLVFQFPQVAVCVRAGRRRGWRWQMATLLASILAVTASYPVWGNWLLEWWVRLRDRPAATARIWREVSIVGLWLCILPLSTILPRMLRAAIARPRAGIVIGSTAFLLAAGFVGGHPSLGEVRSWWGPTPLGLGFPTEAVRLEAAIRSATTVGARVLFEDLSDHAGLGWSAFLPSRTGRPFIGGLDPEGVLEHAACALRDGALAGRPIGFWSDPELDGYARRYNLGCVVCQTRECCNRFARWPAAEHVPVAGVGDWQCFVVRRPPSFALKGSANRFEADGRRVTMTDVVPEDGVVVLSLHYHEGWRVRPSWVRIERELDPYDSIPLVRLRVPARVGRVTLTWDGR